MSVIGFLDRSMSQAGNFPSYSVVQQQYKCLDERMKLFEMKIDTALNAIGEVAVAVDRNATLLNEALTTDSERSPNSQQAFDGISAQLKEIQNELQKMSLIRVGPSSEGDVEVASSRKATEGSVFTESAPVQNEKNSRNVSAFGHTNQLVNGNLSERGDKKQDSSSSSTSSYGGNTERVNKLKDLSNGESDMREGNGAGNFSSPKNDEISAVPQKPGKKPQKLAKIPTFKGSVIKEEPGKCVSYKDMKLCEWKPSSKTIETLGQGHLKFQAKNQEIMVKFTSSNKVLNYKMTAGSNRTIVGERKDAVLFHCCEGLEGSNPVKMLLTTFPSPSVAEDLVRFLDYNCEK
jgi:hypothetical protein